MTETLRPLVFMGALLKSRVVGLLKVTNPLPKDSFEIGPEMKGELIVTSTPFASTDPNTACVGVVMVSGSPPVSALFPTVIEVVEIFVPASIVRAPPGPTFALVLIAPVVTLPGDIRVTSPLTLLPLPLLSVSALVVMVPSKILPVVLSTVTAPPEPIELVSISAVVMLPSAEMSTTPPETVIFPTEISPLLVATGESNVVPPASIAGGTFTGLSSVVFPASKINAGPPVKIEKSGSLIAVKVVSGPVMVISPPLISPVASTFSETPV